MHFRDGFGILAAMAFIGLWGLGCDNNGGNKPWPAGAKASIVVTTAADVADAPFDRGQGDIADLPGADGEVSFREALIAANHTEVPVQIQVAKMIGSPVVAVRSLLPDLTKSDLAINGLIHTQPPQKLVLDLSAVPADGHGLWVHASRVTLQNLSFRGFSFDFEDPKPRTVIGIFGASPPRAPLSDVTVADCEFEGRTAYGIALIFGNLRNIQILRNRLTMTAPSRNGIALVGGTAGYDDRVIEDVQVIGNEISGTMDIPIALFGSGYGGQRNEIRRVEIRNNHIHDILPGVRNHTRCMTICPNAGWVNDTWHAVLRDITIADNNCHDHPGNGLWILGGNNQSAYGEIINMRITGNRFVNTLTGIQVADQFIGPGPGANRIEILVENNFFDTDKYAINVVRLANEPGIIPSTVVVDVGGGPLGSRGQNVFLNSQKGLFSDPLPNFTVFAENNYWGDPSGPADGQAGADADGIPDPSGSGTAVSENIHWAPFLTAPP